MTQIYVRAIYNNNVFIEKFKVQSVFDCKLARCDFGNAQLMFYPDLQQRIVLLCDFHRFGGISFVAETITKPDNIVIGDIVSYVDNQKHCC